MGKLRFGLSTLETVKTRVIFSLSRVFFLELPSLCFIFLLCVGLVFFLSLLSLLVRKIGIIFVFFWWLLKNIYSIYLDRNFSGRKELSGISMLFLNKS